MAPRGARRARRRRRRYLPTALPALLALFGRGLFWPFVPRPGDRDRTETGIWHRIATAVVRRPAVVLTASVALLGAMALGLVGVKVGLSQTDQFRVEAESVTGLEALEEHFPSGAATPLSVLVPVPEVLELVEVLDVELVEVLDVEVVVEVGSSSVTTKPPPTE